MIPRPSKSIWINTKGVLLSVAQEPDQFHGDRAAKATLITLGLLVNRDVHVAGTRRQLGLTGVGHRRAVHVHFAVGGDGLTGGLECVLDGRTVRQADGQHGAAAGGGEDVGVDGHVMFFLESVG